MAQRNSGYMRTERDLYETPAWVTYALVPHLPRSPHAVWEPACGSGKMALALANEFAGVHTSDIHTGTDFLTYENKRPYADTIITNPPFGLATEFVERALGLTWPAGMVAMLLNSDFDHASTRKHLFANCTAFCKTVVLTRRIKWFEGPIKCKHCNGAGFFFTTGKKCKPCSGKGEKNQSPSENHSWFIWDWQHRGASTKAYGP
jgi:hypothetical protein